MKEEREQDGSGQVYLTIAELQAQDAARRAGEPPLPLPRQVVRLCKNHMHPRASAPGVPPTCVADFVCLQRVGSHL